MAVFVANATQVEDCSGGMSRELFLNANPEQVRYCVRTGVDLEAEDISGPSALFRAVAFSNFTEVIEVLLKAGANLEARSGRGWTPLHRVVLRGTSPEMVKALLDAGANLEAQDSLGWTPLHRAVAVNNSADVTKLLLDAGANREARDNEGKTPLHVSARRGYIWTTARALFDDGANLEARDNEGRTPLHWAAAGSKYTDTAKLLLDAGADISARDSKHRTPLHLAAAGEQSSDVVKVLLDVGTDVEARDRDGRTPLHLTAASAGPATVRVLLSAGASLMARDKDGKTPLHLAAARDAFLESYPAVSIVAALLTGGADVTAKDNRGQSPLHATGAYSDSSEIVRLLLHAGADIETRDEEGKTPLHLVAPRGERNSVIGALPLEVRVLTALLDAGANMQARDVEGNTPLHAAARLSESTVMVGELLDAGADRTARNHKGLTPWDLARTNDSLEGTTVFYRLSADRNTRTTEHLTTTIGFDGGNPTDVGLAESSRTREDSQRQLVTTENEASVTRQSAFGVAATSASSNGRSQVLASDCQPPWVEGEPERCAKLNAIEAMARVASKIELIGGLTQSLSPFETDQLEDIVRAADKLAAMDDPRGYYYLAQMHSGGVGKGFDSELARKYLERAVDRDLPEAYGTLGSVYFYGDGVVPDKNKARQMWIKGASFENSYSKFMLENMDVNYARAKRADTLMQDCINIVQRGSGANYKFEIQIAGVTNVLESAQYQQGGDFLLNEAIDLLAGMKGNASEIVPVLVSEYQRFPRRSQMRVIHALGELGHFTRGAARLLADTATSATPRESEDSINGDGEAGERNVALFYLARLEGASQVIGENILPLLESKDRLVRLLAMAAIAGEGHRQHVGSIGLLVDDESYMVRTEAKRYTSAGLHQ